jgi:hypothetical protein
MVFHTQSLQQRREHDGAKCLWKCKCSRGTRSARTQQVTGANAVVVHRGVQLRIDLLLVGVFQVQHVKMLTQKT